jgi:hypothetical protein
MIDATNPKAHRTAASLLKKGSLPRRIGRTKGDLNPKLHAAYILIRLPRLWPQHETQRHPSEQRNNPV